MTVKVHEWDDNRTGTSRWSPRFKVRNPIGRMSVALIAGGTAHLTCFILGAFVDRAFDPFAPVTLILAVFMLVFIPVYVVVRVYWELNPACHRLAWARRAALIATTGGTVTFAIVYFVGIEVLALALPGEEFALLEKSLLLAALVSLLVFGRLRPGDEGGPLWRWKRAKRIESGLCGACGYDLKGNVSGACPECGTEVGRKIQG